MSFVKLDCEILRSTLWLDRAAREVFITALLLARPECYDAPIRQLAVGALEHTGWTAPPGWYGFVPAAGPGIVWTAGLDQAEGMAALERLCAPEPESRSQAHEGRRMIRVDGGYLILNYMKHRDKDHTTAERSKRWRERQAAKRHAVSSQSNAVASHTRDLHSPSGSDLNSPDPDSDARDPADAAGEAAMARYYDAEPAQLEGPPLKRAAPRGLTPGAQPVLLFKFPKTWKPTKDHQTLGRSLGLTDEAMLERAFHCRNKTFAHGFSDPDDQFNRELAWLKTETETANHKKALHERRANHSETPGHTRKPSDKRPPTVFGGGGTR